MRNITHTKTSNNKIVGEISMKWKQVIGLIIAATVFMITGITSVKVNEASRESLLKKANIDTSQFPEFDLPTEDYIGIVTVSGTIQEQSEQSIFDTTSGYQHDTSMEYIDRLIEDTSNKGILLYVDSPGGTVYESEELYNKLKEYKNLTNRPIWTYMAHYAASGGYMTSVAGDVLYANKNTVTGSIGVIMTGYDMSGLYEKLGIRYVSITSGENKDSSKLTDEQIKIYQSQIDEYYENFVDIVAKERTLSKSEVEKVADGRTYTAKQAQEMGLLDEISSYEDMKDKMSDVVGVEEFYEPKMDQNILADLFAKVKDTVPKSEAQILQELSEEKRSGVLMYYADGLQ